MSEIDAMAAQFADAALPFSDPEGAAARALRRTHADVRRAGEAMPGRTDRR